MAGSDQTIQFVTPLPPLRTGIAQYSRDLLTAIAGKWPIQLIAEQGACPDPALGVEFVDAGDIDPDLPTVVQLGNSEFHRQAFDIGLRTSGVAVLHDVVLHHGLLAVALSDRSMPDYWRELWRRYGREGYLAGQALLRGAAVDAMAVPLSERYIERAKLTVVHNRYAERIVRELVPGAKVMRVPMGIPLPPLIARDEARRALGMPESAFLVASISHINPNKRLPVVLRAIKRLAAWLPEVMFVVAGSRSPAVDIERHVRALGLGERVIVTGYVDERQARLIAAAADACVNLRHPPSGETSASLLRLLGAGKPVLVTDGAASEDLPPGVGLRVPVDRLEEEFIADLLFELARNDSLREQAGRASRRFVEERHSMGAAIEGYRAAIAEAFGINLPGCGEVAIQEPVPDLSSIQHQGRTDGFSTFDRMVAAAIGELGLSGHRPLLATVSRAMVDLQLDRMPKGLSGSPGSAAVGYHHGEDLDARLACARCRGRVVHEGMAFCCVECGAVWMVEDGVPRFAE